MDQDYGGDISDRKSMSGYLVKLGKSLCVWGYKNEGTAALSTCEAEYHAMTLVAKEVVWERRVLQEWGAEMH